MSHLASLVLLLVATSTGVDGDVKCPNKCHCLNLEHNSIKYVCQFITLSAVGENMKAGERITELWAVTNLTSLTKSEVDHIRNKGIAHIKLVNGPITEIEIGAFENFSSKINFVDLSNNKIQSLRKGMLKGLEPCAFLTFLRNLIIDIEVGTFDDLHNIESLSLSFNRLTKLKNGVFHGLTQMKHLELYDNAVKVIEPHAFNGLENLMYLFLAGNELTSVSAEMFKGLKNLELLNLDNNKLTKIARGMLPRLDNLKEFYISMNRIDTIDNGALSSFPGLVSLNVRGNALRDLNRDSLLGLKRLQNLNLGANPFRHLSGEWFRDLKEVVYLYASETHLEVFPKDVLVHMPSLTSLWLANNNLTTLDVDFLLNHKTLRQIVIEGNPLHCDCIMKKLWAKFVRNIPEYFTYMREKNYRQDSPTEITCFSPPELSGKVWDILYELNCV